LRDAGFDGLFRTKKSLQRYLKNGLKSHDDFRDLLILIDHAVDEDLPDALIGEANHMLLKYEDNCSPEV